MNDLANICTAYKCLAHTERYCYVLTRQNQQGGYKFICPECLIPEYQSKNLITIKKAKTFLGEQQIQGFDTTYLFMASLWQNFKRNQMQIISTLTNLEHQIIQYFEHILKNEQIMALLSKFFDENINYKDINILGLYINENIEQDHNGKYQYTSVGNQQQNGSFIQFDQKLSDCQKVIKELNQNLDIVLEERKCKKKECKNESGGSTYSGSNKSLILDCLSCKELGQLSFSVFKY